MEDNYLRPWKLARGDVPGREDMEAGPSVIMEESVVGNRRSGYMQQKQNIFLSHSGVQKAFVRRLRNALERNAYFPFFDEDPDALPKGELFARLIKSACRQADVAVIVLSDEFLTSKWPMIELAIFVKEQMRRSSPECQELKILPLFMGFSIEEFRNTDRQTSWQNKWKEMGVKDNRIDASEWDEALKVLGRTNGLEYCRFKNEEEYIESIVSAILKLVPPDLRWGDTHMKGKSKFHQTVSEMFARSPSRTRFHKVRTIGLYGTGGIGKTTLCKSLCDHYFSEFDGKVWHVELGKQSAELVQKDVLRHLVGISETLLNHSVACKNQWQSLMPRDMEYKVFLAIDNLWNEVVSREQVEALLEMGFHPESLVIVTSRSRGLLEWLGIHEDCCFEMPMLDKDDATEILLESAAPGCHMASIADHQRAAVVKVVERCFMTKGPISCAESEKQYIPLALKVLGRQLRLPLFGAPAELADWVNNLDLKWSDQKQHQLFSVLGYSYDKLPSSEHKNIFLDVALCVPRQEDNTSASVSEVCKWLSMVYDCDVGAILRVLQDLQWHGLVEKWQGPASRVGMHELYYEFAKVEAAKVAHLDEQYYLYDEDGRYMPALMRWFPGRNHLPLRRIHVYTGGFTKLSSREFQFMANVEVLKLDFCFELESLDVRCLESLRSVELRGCFSLEEVTGLSDLSGLSFFRWNTCRLKLEYAMPDFPQALKVVEIYGSKDSIMRTMGSFGDCIGLLELTLRRHPLLVAVPDLSNLRKLQKVDFSGCCSVEAVPGLGGLRQLRHLNLENCKRLGSCAGLETLVEIETLNLGGCVGIQLPGVWDLSMLMKLRSINIRGILVVHRLVLGSSQLEQLNVMGCSDLRTVALVSNDSVSWKSLDCLNEQRSGDPAEAWQWTVECGIVVEHNSFDNHESVNLSNCLTLESLGGIGSLSSLKYLYLRNCSILKTLPNLSHAPCLEVVDLSHCCMLADLGEIGPLRALQYLYLKKCGSLRCLRDLGSPGLKVLDLSGCSKVEDLGSFDSLSALQMLILTECVSLEALPSLRNSSLLEVLDVSGCTKLSALSKMTTRKVVINISGCWSLESIPILIDLSKLELDVTVGDEVEDAAEISGDVLSLKLTCHVGNSTCQRSDKLSWEVDIMDKFWGEPQCLFVSTFELNRSIYPHISHAFEEPSSSEIRQLANISQASEEERGFFPVKLFGDGVHHFRSIKTLLELAKWVRGNALFPQLTQVKFSSVSVTSESLTGFPSSNFFSTVSRLELIKCRRLRRLSNLDGLLALETLVIAHCDELENLPDLGKSAALKHLTIRDFRQGPRFQFLSYLCQPVHAYPNEWAPFHLRSLVELNFDNCVGLGGLEHWGPLPALEALVIKDCNTVIQLPDLRRSSKLSKVIVINCENFTQAVHVGSEEALRFARIEGCGNQLLKSYLSRGELCEALRMHSRPYGYSRVGWGVMELIRWLERGETVYSCMDMFSELNFSRFRFTSQELGTFNALLIQCHSSILK